MVRRTVPRSGCGPARDRCAAPRRARSSTVPGSAATAVPGQVAARGARRGHVKARKSLPRSRQATDGRQGNAQVPADRPLQAVPCPSTDAKRPPFRRRLAVACSSISADSLQRRGSACRPSPGCIAALATAAARDARSVNRPATRPLPTLRQDDTAQVQQIGALLFALSFRLLTRQVGSPSTHAANEVDGALAAVTANQPPDRLGRARICGRRSCGSVLATDLGPMG